jgi:hypothetical protein
VERLSNDLLLHVFTVMSEELDKPWLPVIIEDEDRFNHAEFVSPTCACARYNNETTAGSFAFACF